MDGMSLLGCDGAIWSRGSEHEAKSGEGIRRRTWEDQAYFDREPTPHRKATDWEGELESSRSA